MNKKLIVVLSAIMGGLLLDYLNIPAGAIVGSILGTAVSQTLVNTKVKISLPVKRSIRVIMGCYIGLGITLESIMQIKDILGAAVIVIIGVILMSLLVTFALNKFCNWELREAFLGSLPAGLSEIGMNAEEFNVDPIAVTTIHIMRLITILVFIPLVIKFL